MNDFYAMCGWENWWIFIRFKILDRFIYRWTLVQPLEEQNRNNIYHNTVCVCVILCQPLLFQVLSIHLDNSLCGELRRIGLVFVYLIGCFIHLKHENPLCGERIVFRFAWLYRALLIWISSLNLSLASLNAFYSNTNFRLVEERRREWSERQIFECDCVNILSLRWWIM